MPTTKTVVGNRAKETSATAGTGNITLDGAVAGFRSLVAAAQDASGDSTGPWEVAYEIFENSVPPKWEMGVGTLTAGPPDTLARSSAKVESSTNGGSLETFSGEDKDVFITFLAESAYELFDKSQSAGYLKQTSNGTPSAPAKITISRIATIPIADGGTGAVNAGDARTNLGLAIGSDVQAYSARLADIVAMGSPADNVFIVGTGGGGWGAESASTARTSLGLGGMALLGAPTRTYVKLASDQAIAGTTETIISGFDRLDFPGVKDNSNKYMIRGIINITYTTTNQEMTGRLRIGATGNGLTDTEIFRTRSILTNNQSCNLAFMLEDAPDTSERVTLTIQGNTGAYSVLSLGTVIEIIEVID